MKAVPLLVQCAHPARSNTEMTGVSATVDEELPGVVSRDASGLVRARSTRLTEVQKETTDDT